MRGPTFSVSAQCYTRSSPAGALSLAWGGGPRSPPAAPSDWKLTRLTADAGLATSPALSSDGKVLAYSSDGGRDGGLDLYIKQAAGGQPIRLTSDGADNRQPDF